MDREALFQRTVDQLADIVQTRPFEEYATLEASALLRKLLLDESPLLHQINRQRRKRITFEVNAHGREDFEELSKIVGDQEFSDFVLDGISPRVWRLPAGTRHLKLDGFLALPTAFHFGHEVTVKDVILQVAHVEGGVHAGTPKTELERLLQEANRSLKLQDVGMVCRALYGITDVVVAAMDPLRRPIH